MPVSDKRKEKQLPEHLWKPGTSGNPKGRPKGARAKLGEAFIADLLVDWEANGVSAISEVRENKPDAYLKVVASILPKDLNINVNPMEELDDADLLDRIRDIDAAIRPFLDAKGALGDSEGATPPTAH